MASTQGNYATDNVGTRTLVSGNAELGRRDIADPEELIELAAALSSELETPIAPGFDALVFEASRESRHLRTHLHQEGRQPLSGRSVRHGPPRRTGKHHQFWSLQPRSLPVSGSRAGPGRVGAQHGPDTRKLTGAETIPLVEDEERLRSLIRAIPTTCGYDVLEVQSGGDALLLCEDARARSTSC